MSRRSRKRRVHKKQAVFDRRYSIPGTPPGTLEHHDAPPPAPRLRVVDYDAERHTEKVDPGLEEARASLDHPDVTWIHVHGPVNAETLRTLGERFELHPLALEDVLNRGQRPKWDVHGEALFTILSYPQLASMELSICQVSLFLGKSYLISFFEGPEDPFEPIVKRMRLPNQRFKGRGPDFLFHALTDLVIDQSFPVLEALGAEIEEIEFALTDDPGPDDLARIQRLKRQLVTLRRLVWPHRDLISAIIRDDHGFIHQDTKVYLRDVYDHAVQVVDLIETYRDMAGSLMEIYLSSISHKLNEVMRVLTVISTIFIPLSFLVGIYGMNFEHMPELKWRYGYLAVWGVVAAAAGGMLVYFRRRGWV
jgi:magnesium transporter